ncbi:MAG: hypothetical protein MK212_18680 [Saprospiraceae bacterium]|nr:hypothetical protein [Saprospiraceae bacterium]
MAFYLFNILHKTTAIITPTIGATIYIQSEVESPLTRAGAIERAGFIDAPDMGPANKAS